MSTNFPAGLYIGETHVNVQHLSTELYLEIGIRCFNGTGQVISVDRILGFVWYHEQKGNSLTRRLQLPPAVILSDNDKPNDLANMTERHITVRQPFPRNVAESATAVLADGRSLHLYFADWQLMAQVADAPERVARLPLWDGVTIGKRSDSIATGRVFTLGIREVALARDS